jgi:hypothetical protein
MHCPHVTVNSFAPRESLQANPAYMGLTSDAGHMIAPFSSLDGNFATRAIFYVVILHPFLEELVSTVTVWAFKTLMVLNVTVQTDPQQT